MPLDPRTPPRHSLIPTGYTVRLIAMIGALILIGATIYNQRERARAAKRPPAANRQVAANDAEQESKTEWQETIVPGPADDDPVEMEAAKNEFQAVLDTHKVGESDMWAYWRLVNWARSLSFAEMEERAQRDIPFSDLFLNPEKHRGELIRLRLHVRRVTGGKVRENPAGVEMMYDLWGTTDESRANFYAVACSELPPEIPVSTDAFSEVVFVGYFFKNLGYHAGDDKERGAPMLIGRVKAVASGKNLAQARSDGLMAMVAIGFAIIAAALIIVALWRMTRKRGRSPLPATLPSRPAADVEAWLQNSLEEEPSAKAVYTNGQAAHAVGPTIPDSNDQLE
jgi:hypothetical protein